MTDARCEPPEHLRGEEGPHWLSEDGPEDIYWWERGWDGWAWRNRVGEVERPEALAAMGYTYLAPVPSPADVARLVEAGRRMSECDLGLIPEEGCTCETCEAWHALRAALAPFKEPGA